MIIHDKVEQGTDEWHALRAGKFTGSGFSKLITGTGKASTSLKGYVNEVVAEVIMGGVDMDGFKGSWMERGHEIEPQARSWYEFQMDQEIREVGFVESDDHLKGVSPDGLFVDQEGGIEIKCPKPSTMVKYLSEGRVPLEYVPQVQGSMLVCECERWEFLAFHPKMPPLHLVVPRDDKYIATLQSQLKIAVEMRAELLEKIRSQS